MKFCANAESSISYVARGEGLVPVNPIASGTNGLLVALEVVYELADMIAAEFVQRRVDKRDRHHRFADDTGGRHDADVGAFVKGGRELGCDQVCRWQRP